MQAKYENSQVTPLPHVPIRYHKEEAPLKPFSK